jgi:hypothetical protein
MELNIFTASPSYKKRPRLHSRAGAELEMCGKCIELDVKIERYKRLSSQIIDQPTLDGITKLIADLQAQKIALHRERTE